MVEQLRAEMTFAGYRIERMLGSGGMGEVYLAHDRDLPRFVALKLLNRVASDDDETRRRFLREANIIARLSHPNIVTIYARGEEQGQLWLAMAYVDGSDLSAELLAGPLEPQRAAAITADVARALDYAHDAGVLHRDVKPANILLTAQPREWALLSDFGIAQSNHEVRGITENGEVMASFQYTAPERFHGGARVDRRADVYSLGCTLFEMLTGAPPYADSDLPRLIYGHVSAAVPSVRALNPALPAALDPILARAMAKNPGHRFATCTELSAAVTEALAAPRSRTAVPPPREDGRRSAIPVSRESGRRGAIAVSRDGRRSAVPVTRESGRHSAILPSGSGAKSRLPLVLLAVAVATGAVAAAVALISSLTGSSDHSNALLTTTGARVTPRAATTTTPASVSASAGIAADGCPSRRTPDAVSGIDVGSTATGPDAILGFQYAYYVLRSGTAARRFVADDSASVADAPKIQTGIDSVPAGTRYCVQVTRIAPADDDHWSVKITQQPPGQLPDVFTQTVTTRTDAGRTLITSIDE
ncbi:serine/threonine-protein kinase [Nocardia seriolae]|uniref:non-specific serine/threonine protein kinase n=1 Tax=Nocardia seriolae TaxID=37332 RepID=A0ABC8AYB0_9NOCA|nr:serine/threonine-protein kinase [Nocardia seriolae]APA98989.1 cAMP-dependent protein kinase [Nocardia seriolae]MTJ64039.1 protein kinase [Nocardia seriolae]MTJ71293.1 protein kinase [Nocardia seriolae]MTJ88600.1 protein kinase [Nocardia seriolae]MTK32584.1 protein kinase [Nocardia seriolae]